MDIGQVLDEHEELLRSYNDLLDRHLEALAVIRSQEGDIELLRGGLLAQKWDKMFGGSGQFGYDSCMSATELLEKKE